MRESERWMCCSGLLPLGEGPEGTTNFSPSVDESKVRIGCSGVLPLGEGPEGMANLSPPLNESEG